MTDSTTDVTPNIMSNVSDHNKITRYIFESKDHLIKIILKHKDSVFTDTKISESLILHLCDNFITHSRHISDISNVKERTEFFIKTIRLLGENFHIDNAELSAIYHIDILSNKPIGKGTYSKVLSSDTSNDVIKLMRSKNPHNECVFDLVIKRSMTALWQFITDMFTYIVWSCISKHINGITIMNHIELIGFSDYLCSIKRPFIMYNSNDNNTFYAGYVMTRYAYPVSKLFNEQIESDTNVLCILLSIIKILYKIHLLSFCGITLLHRDITTSNIMIDDNKNVKLIDFGYALTSIFFANGSSFKLGIFFDEIYDHIVEPYYDFIFFILYMIVNHHKVLVKFKLYKKLKNLVMYKENSRLIDPKDDAFVWSYPYKAKSIDKESFLHEIVTLCLATSASGNNKN